MSPCDRPDDVALLRAAITRIENGQPATTGGRTAAPMRPGRRRSRAADGRPPVPLGGDGLALDVILGGGLRAGALHEIVPATPRDEGAASGFALALAIRCLGERGTLVWIVDDNAAGESGVPYRPGLQAHGLDPDRLVMVRTKGAEATLWAAEEALRVRDVVMLVELWAGRLYGLVPSRRLVLAARGSGAIGLVLHAGLPGAARALSSSSDTRFLAAACPSRPLPAASGPLPVPGITAVALRLDKLRAPPADVDRAATHVLLWHAEQRCFHEPDLSVALAAPSSDRPDRAQGGRA